MRCDDICLYVNPLSRSRLDTLIKDRNSSRKVVWRAEIVLATADGHGTNEIMRHTGKSKPCVWRWQERYVAEGVERFIAEIAGKRIRRGTFTSVTELEQAIDGYLLHHNAATKPYVWTNTADEILDKERRALDKLDVIKSVNQPSDSEH